MIVTCPGCAANYRVRNEQVPDGGAKMRCPQCQTTFLAMLPKTLREPAPVTGVAHKAAPPPQPAAPVSRPAAVAEHAPAAVLTSDQLPATREHAMQPLVDSLKSAAVAPARTPSQVNFNAPTGSTPPAPGASTPAAAGPTPPFPPPMTMPPSPPVPTPHTLPPSPPVPTPHSMPPQRAVAPSPFGPDAASPRVEAPSAVSSGGPAQAPWASPGTPAAAPIALPAPQRSAPPPPPAAAVTPSPQAPVAGADPFAGALPSGPTSAPGRPPTNSHMASTSMEQLMQAMGHTAASNPNPAAPVSAPPHPASRGPADDFDPFAEIDVAPNPPPGMPVGSPSEPPAFQPLPTSSDFEILDEPTDDSGKRAIAKLELRKSNEGPAVRNIVERFPTDVPTPSRGPSRLGRAAAMLIAVVGMLALLVGGLYFGWAAGALPLSDVLLPKLEQELDIRPAVSSIGRDDTKMSDLVARAQVAATSGDTIDELVTHLRILRLDPNVAPSVARVHELSAELALESP